MPTIFTAMQVGEMPILLDHDLSALKQVWRSCNCCDPGQG